jgi:hypothetical protein
MGKVNAMYQDKIGAEYERGAINAYYGRRPNPNHSDVYLLEAYMVAAMLRAEHLQETCEFELKALDGERFIPYSLKQEQ